MLNSLIISLQRRPSQTPPQFLCPPPPQTPSDPHGLPFPRTSAASSCSGTLAAHVFAQQQLVFAAQAACHALAEAACDASVASAVCGGMQDEEVLWAVLQRIKGCEGCVKMLSLKTLSTSGDSGACINCVSEGCVSDQVLFLTFHVRSSALSYISCQIKCSFLHFMLEQVLFLTFHVRASALSHISC